MTAGVTQTLFAQTLARLTGLSFTAALAWSAAEVGSNNNLGLMPATSNCPVATTADGKTYCAYPTPAAGAAAAAQLINSSSMYAGIRASAGKSVQEQLNAILHSPWHLGRTDGADPYYAGIFKQYGYVPGAGSSGGGTFQAPAASAPPAGAGASSPPATMPTINIAAGHVLNAGDVLYLTQTLAAAGWFPGWGGAHSAGAAYLNGLAGQAWSPALLAQIATHFGASQASTAGAVPAADALAAFLNFSWVPAVAIAGGVLVAVLVLAHSGVEELLG